MTPPVQPLSYRHRFLFFYLLTGIFVAALPFLFLYATGYRLEWGGGSLVSTGGLYIAAERTGAQIYIDDNLVRETRIFRRAFYAQGLDSGTHKVHVQKFGHHTWVKELPVYPHLVTEAQAFNLPIVPSVRVITEWETPAGVPVLTATSSVLQKASSTNQFLFEPRAATSTLESNVEFVDLLKQFAAPDRASTDLISRTRANLTGSAATSSATTTKEWRGVRLSESADEVYASFVGSREEMPYYYCADTFPRWEGATTTASTNRQLAAVAKSRATDLEEIALPVQIVSDEKPCDPIIKLDRGSETVSYFDFFPNSTDLVVLALGSGAYVVEIDNRAWQNRQSLLLGDNLAIRVYNGAIYAYDGKVIYQITVNQSWF